MQLSDVSGILSSRRKMNIGIIGRPYLIFDRHISKNLFRHITDLGANPVYIRPDEAEIREAMTVIPKWVYWDLGKEVVAAAHSFFKDSRIDGVINICSATCGPDSFTGDLIRKRLNPGNKPYMSLSIDEHASDTGIQTRLEAFIDMIAKVTA
jgi:predicted nucleotide-binding protein (sugar kinase/HSP70/actin superfamily)